MGTRLKSSPRRKDSAELLHAEGDSYHAGFKGIFQGKGKNEIGSQEGPLRSVGIAERNIGVRTSVGCRSNLLRPRIKEERRTSQRVGTYISWDNFDGFLERED